MKEAKTDPAKEQAHDIANNSQKARTTAAKNQRSYGSQMIMVEESIDSSNQPDDPQASSHPMNDISFAGENRPPLLENQYSLSHSSASAAALEGVPVSETQSEGRTHFRPTQDGWEQRKRDATGAFIGEWKKTREFEPVWNYVGKPEFDELPRSALASFGKAYNRADDIARKKSLYERELQSLEPSSDRAQFLRKLLPLFDQAIAYQNDIMQHLQPRNEENKGLLSEHETERVAAERQAALRDSIRLENIMTINSRPNQVERLIEQIEKEEAERLDAQERLAQIQARLATPGQSARTLSFLNKAAEEFEDAVVIYPGLIEARLDSARLIQAPYKKSEEIDPLIQDQIEVSKKDLLDNQAVAGVSYRYGKNSQARLIVTGNSHSSRYLDHQENFLEIATEEYLREEGRQAVIDLCFRAADFFEGAVALLDNQNDLNREARLISLNYACHSLLKAGKEAQKDKPQQVVIDYCLRATDFYERAAAVFDYQNDLKRAEVARFTSYDIKRAECLDKAGHSLCKAAEQAGRATPNKEVIEIYLKEALAFEAEEEKMQALVAAFIIEYFKLDPKATHIQK